MLSTIKMMLLLRILTDRKKIQRSRYVSLRKVTAEETVTLVQYFDL